MKTKNKKWKPEFYKVTDNKGNVVNHLLVKYKKGKENMEKEGYKFEKELK